MGEWSPWVSLTHLGWRRIETRREETVVVLHYRRVEVAHRDLSAGEGMGG